MKPRARAGGAGARRSRPPRYSRPRSKEAMMVFARMPYNWCTRHSIHEYLDPGRSSTYLPRVNWEHKSPLGVPQASRAVCNTGWCLNSYRPSWASSRNELYVFGEKLYATGDGRCADRAGLGSSQSCCERGCGRSPPGRLIAGAAFFCENTLLAHMHVRSDRRLCLQTPQPLTSNHNLQPSARHHPDFN